MGVRMCKDASLKCFYKKFIESYMTEKEISLQK